MLKIPFIVILLLPSILYSSSPMLSAFYRSRVLADHYADLLSNAISITVSGDSLNFLLPTGTHVKTITKIINRPAVSGFVKAPFVTGNKPSNDTVFLERLMIDSIKNETGCIFVSLWFTAPNSFSLPFKYEITSQADISELLNKADMPLHPAFKFSDNADNKEKFVQRKPGTFHSTEILQTDNFFQFSDRNRSDESVTDSYSDAPEPNTMIESFMSNTNTPLVDDKSESLPGVFGSFPSE